LRAALATAEGLLRRRGPGVTRRLSARERRVESVAALLFVLVSAAILGATGGNLGDPLSVAELVAAYALMARIRFQLGPGLVRPTELVFVPMLFLLPAAAVPALVAAGSILSELPEILGRRAHPERALVAVADSWYAVGPAAVVTLMAPGRPAAAAWSVYVLALLAQFVVDFGASTAREWLGAGIRPRELAPVLGIVYLIDALLAPIGLLAVIATRVGAQAWLLAAAPGVLLALIARERRKRIDGELALAAAYRRFTRLLDDQAEELHRQTGRIEHAHHRLGEPVACPVDRRMIERLLLTTAIEAVQADCGRLSGADRDGDPVERLAVGRLEENLPALRAAEAAFQAGQAARQVAVGATTALAVSLGSRTAREHAGRRDLLAVARAGPAFSPAERELLEHLAAQATVSLENLRLQELMHKTEQELRAILEGVADGVTAEDHDGRLVYVNAAAMRLLSDQTGDPVGETIARLDVADETGAPVPAGRLPARRALAGEGPEPLVVRSWDTPTGETRWSRLKATPVFDEHGQVRLAISVIEDITEIKQAEDAQRFLAESSRVLSGSLDLDETLPAIARLAVPDIADWCAVHLVSRRGLRSVAAAHGDPAKQVVAELLAAERPMDAVARVVRSGRSELCCEVPASEEAYRSLGTVSAMVVPMRARDQVLGAITLGSAASGRRFGAGDLALAEDLGVRAGAAVDNARLYRTRSAIAQTLQASLLPPVLPEIARLETAALYRAAGEGHEVGGDFYDVFSTNEKQWFVVMGDVCGKGAEAAAVTALARYTIRAAVVRHRSPAGILRWLNDAMLRQRADPGRFATVACARLDLDRDDICVTVASGGHPCPRVLRWTGLVEEAGVPGTLLGAIPHVRLEDRTTRLTRGDALVFFTDGLTEAGAPERVWSPAQLDAAVAAARRQPARGIVDHLAHAALGDASAPVRDDFALLALRMV
jgi:PAS domain S-box-containing protein